jgi:hypothetical protein
VHSLYLPLDPIMKDVMVWFELSVRVYLGHAMSDFHL